MRPLNPLDLFTKATMADITDANDQTSPTDLEESHVGNGTAGESRGVKRARPSTADDDDDDDDKNSRERRKIEIKFINDKSRRHITFSKRKAGIMKKVCTYSCCDRKPHATFRMRPACTFDALQRAALQKLCSRRMYPPLHHR